MIGRAPLDQLYGIVERVLFQSNPKHHDLPDTLPNH
jgi:hypothetical protein